VAPTTEVVAGDLFDPASLDRALAGIDVAYYLVHSMGAHGDYLEKDRVAARNCGEAARRAGVRRIVYLGGLATGEETLSKHLRSRIETGQVLRGSGVSVVEFRASVVIGSGSLSFELIRDVVPVADGAVVHQTAVFEPVGWSGLIYWYVLFPVHTLIFGGLLCAIARRAVEGDADSHRVAPGAPS
jgi:uncharacterized protein YbjT (DUF2867 family)